MAQITAAEVTDVVPAVLTQIVEIMTVVIYDIRSNQRGLSPFHRRKAATKSVMLRMASAREVISRGSNIDLCSIRAVSYIKLSVDRSGSKWRAPWNKRHLIYSP